MRSTGLKRKMGAVAIAITVAVLGSGVAMAHHGNWDNLFPTAHYNSGNSVCTLDRLCLADSSWHTFHFDQSMTSMKGAFRDRFTHYDLGSDISTHELSTLDTGIDAVIKDGSSSLPSSRLAEVNCLIPQANNDYCLQFEILVNLDKADNEGWSWNKKKKVACHEIGHTLGLVHGSNAEDLNGNAGLDDNHFSLYCMVTPWSASNSRSYASYHNFQVLNNEY